MEMLEQENSIVIDPVRKGQLLWLLGIKKSKLLC